MTTTDEAPWWRGAAIYQIYPRSFQDTDGDGIGDLAGITRRLDYVASLGVDAIWISPFFTSPMRDFGYDVSDYCDVDPIFGTLADFDALVERAHALGLKVIVDQVFAHTSDLHPWFAESRTGEEGDKADWYVWADPRPDGTPPNNWQSVFGGPAWTWDARRRQYYMHTFLKEQPQLNVHNPRVQDALLGVARFWLERGVDGFRLDALNHAMHDPQLRDNPPAPDNGQVRTRPFDYQIKRFSQSHPGVVDFIERIRALCDEYGVIHTVAEVGGDNAEAEMRAYISGDTRLDSAYGFDFLYAPDLTPQFVEQALARWPDDTAWPTWAFENHDAPRALSRWCGPAEADRFARFKLALLIGLPGNIMIYQGEELGLRQDEIPFELLRDPEAIANWPLTLSRDGARTPMPWTPSGGFTTGTPWLPQFADNLSRSIEAQAASDASQLNTTRRLLKFRRDTPPLRRGRLTRLSSEGPLLVFGREWASDLILCLFNFAADAIPVPDHLSGRVVLSVNDATETVLAGHSALLLRMDS